MSASYLTKGYLLPLVLNRKLFPAKPRFRLRILLNTALQAATTRQMEFICTWSKTLSSLRVDTFFLLWVTPYRKIVARRFLSKHRHDGLINCLPLGMCVHGTGCHRKTREYSKTRLTFLLSVISMKIGSCYSNELLCCRPFSKVL